MGRIITIFFFFILIPNKVLGSEIKKIINEFEKINKINFNFVQSINDLTETGLCIIEFEGKLLCEYNEIKNKKILIENSVLYLMNEDKTITNYNISNSSILFLTQKTSILQRLNKIKDVQTVNNIINIKLDFEYQEPLILYFNNKSFLISGWQMRNFDGSQVVFDIRNLEINKKDQTVFSLN